MSDDMVELTPRGIDIYSFVGFVCEAESIALGAARVVDALRTHSAYNWKPGLILIHVSRSDLAELDALLIDQVSRRPGGYRLHLLWDWRRIVRRATGEAGIETFSVSRQGCELIARMIMTSEDASREAKNIAPKLEEAGNTEGDKVTVTLDADEVVAVTDFLLDERDEPTWSDGDGRVLAWWLNDTRQWYVR